MKKIILNLIISSVLLLIGCSGNEYTCISNVPKELIGNFKSYQTIKSFEDIVISKTDTLIVFENSKLSENDTRPEFSIYTVILPEFKIENTIGKLKANFFNDRLMTVSFYPNDKENFEKILLKKYGFI